MTAWHEWFSFFRETRVRLEIGTVPDFGKADIDRPARMRASEKRVRTKVDEICRHWIIAGEWPKMTTIERWFVCQRMGAAQLFLLPLMAPGNGTRCAIPSRKASDVEFRRWLLIDSWPWTCHLVLGVEAMLPAAEPARPAQLQN